MHALTSALSHDTSWIAVSAIVTAIMAFYTRRLAAETGKALESSADQMRQAEIHHRESVSPSVFLTITCRVVRQDNTVLLCVAGSVANLGPGAAGNVVCVVQPLGWWRKLEADVATIVNPCSVHDFTVTWPLSDEPGSDPGPIPFRYGVRYNDLFGDEGWTIQESSSGSASLLETLESVLPSAHLQFTRKTRDTFYVALGRHLQ